MCYLIARKEGTEGCIALHTSHGKQLSTFKKEISVHKGCEEIELITISRPSAYVEYEPYHFAKSEREFLEWLVLL